MRAKPSKQIQALINPNGIVRKYTYTTAYQRIQGHKITLISGYGFSELPQLNGEFAKPKAPFNTWTFDTVKDALRAIKSATDQLNLV